MGEPVHDERPHYRHDVPERWVRFRALGGEEDADGQGPINGADRIAGRKQEVADGSGHRPTPAHPLGFNLTCGHRGISQLNFE